MDHELDSYPEQCVSAMFQTKDVHLGKNFRKFVS